MDFGITFILHQALEEKLMVLPKVCHDFATTTNIQELSTTLETSESLQMVTML